MKIKILPILFILFLNAQFVYAHNCPYCEYNNRPNYIKQKQIDKMLDERLKLTDEQKDVLRKNRSIHQKEMNKILADMEKKHTQIRDIYYSGIPKFQADIKTAPMKAELYILKQNADKLRIEHRKTFENILSDEQKIEFELIKKQRAQKRIK